MDQKQPANPTLAAKQDAPTIDTAEDSKGTSGDAVSGVIESRRACCSTCTRCGGVDGGRVECNAAGRAVSLIHGRCRLRLWPSPPAGVVMPAPPPPPPEVPRWMKRPPVPHSAWVTPQNQSQAGSLCHCLFVYGFPGLYAGACTELHHQIILWRSMGLAVHLIPTDKGYKKEPLYQEMLDRGVTVHGCDEFSAIPPGSLVLGFCNDRFLANIDRILEYSHNTVFVNCMTWLFDKEKQRQREGKIAAFLYQNDVVREHSQAALQAINPDPVVQYLTFKPYFDTNAFPFIAGRANKDSGERNFTVGHISRADADKFAGDTIKIWEAIDSPVPKRGVMLGYGKAIEEKTGKPPAWVTTYENQKALSQQDFYAQVDVIVQPTDTTENWPRVGLEAMASGAVLIVDNRGGWQQMIEHGKTGWLCDTPKDFITYATRMANEPAERIAIANAARQRLEEIAGHSASRTNWTTVLQQLSVDACAAPHTNTLAVKG